MSALASFGYGLATGGFHVGGGVVALILGSPYDRVAAFTSTALTTYLLTKAPPFPDLAYAGGYAMVMAGTLHYLKWRGGESLASPPESYAAGLFPVVAVIATPFLGASVYFYATS